MNNKKLKIGVVFGGRSSEKEVSLAGGRNVYHNIDRSKFEPIAIYLDGQSRLWQIPESLVIRNTCKEIDERLKERGAVRLKYENLPEIVDLVFLTTHGKYGEDGCLQGLLELLGVPYTGSGVLSSALTMDKAMQRKLMASYGGINIPEYMVVERSSWDRNHENIIKQIEKKFGYPCVAKPTREGSTFGVSAIHSLDEISTALEKAFEFDNTALIEKFIHGREFSCIVMGNEEPEALSVTETLHKEEIFTYDEKYLPGASNKITPMQIGEGTIKEIQMQAIRTFKALGCRNYARIDGFVTEDSQVLITDPNSAAGTGMSASSFTWHQAAAKGMTTSQFITKLIELALESHKNKRGPL